MNASVDFEQLANAIGDAVVVSDVEGRVTLWNPAAEPGTAARRVLMRAV